MNGPTASAIDLSVARHDNAEFEIKITKVGVSPPVAYEKATSIGNDDRKKILGVYEKICAAFRARDLPAMLALSDRHIQWLAGGDPIPSMKRDFEKFISGWFKDATPIEQVPSSDVFLGLNGGLAVLKPAKKAPGLIYSRDPDGMVSGIGPFLFGKVAGQWVWLE